MYEREQQWLQESSHWRMSCRSKNSFCSPFAGPLPVPLLTHQGVLDSRSLLCSSIKSRHVWSSTSVPWLHHEFMYASGGKLLQNRVSGEGHLLFLWSLVVVHLRLDGSLPIYFRMKRFILILNILLSMPVFPSHTQPVMHVFGFSKEPRITTEELPPIMIWI